MIRKRLVFRRHYANALTIPLLLNILEGSSLMKELDVFIADQAIAAGRNDLVLYSLMTPFLHEHGDEWAALSRQGAQILVGGPHGNEDNHRLLLKMGATAVCAAPAEKALLPLIEAFLYGSLARCPFWPAQESDEGLLSAFLPLSERLVTVPPLELMRGCGYACTFCATAGKRRVIRSLESVEAYLDQLRARGHKRVNFIVPSALDLRLEGGSVAASLDRLLACCRRRNISLVEYGIFPSEIRPETVNAECVDVIRGQVANRSLTLGVQSGSRLRLGQLRRSVDGNALEKAMQTVLAGGFGLNLDLIVGYPDEDEAEFRDSLNHLLALRKKGKVRVQVHRFFPLGNSALEWRLPSQLTPWKYGLLDRLEGQGVITRGWRQNDAQWTAYYSWLSRVHPEWAARYR